MRLVLFALLLLAAAAASPARAQNEERVDLELVLAVDISLSMDAGEREFQRNGYIEALNSPEVLAAILEGGWGRIAITYMEWAGEGFQTVVAPWRLIDSEQAMRAFTDTIAAAPSRAYHRTSISGALSYSASLFDGNGFAGLRRVIDVSGDGPNNQGEPVTLARDRLVDQGIIINGLPVMINQPGYGFFDIADLDRYYENCVIGGTQSFIMPATAWEGFALAVRRKLILEIALAPDAPRLVPAQASAMTDDGIDCMIGEKMWNSRRWMFDDP
ncbi:MAG: DUF1194 domain-containing protein [Flavobacteriaceae bacterium]